MITIDEGIIQEFPSVDLVITVDGRVGHPVHNHQCTTEPKALQVIKVIIDGLVPFVDDPYTPRVLLPVSEEKISLRYIIVSMTVSKGAAAFVEGIVFEDVPTGFIGYDLVLTIAMIEIVIRHFGKGLCKRIMGGTDPHGLPSVCTQVLAVAEEVMIDHVMILLAEGIDQPDDHCRADVLFLY